MPLAASSFGQQPRPISRLGAALLWAAPAWPYTGLAFNTGGGGELDDLPADVGIGVRRGTDGAAYL